MDKSRKLQQRAERVFPGGVNSPVRAFGAVGGEPPFIVRGEGSKMWDADGNSYIDYVGSWGPLILGHAAPEIVAAIERQIKNGSSFGASTPVEAELGEAILAILPAVEKIRFVSSGTEATMSAIRLARAATKRKYIIKFEGCYHGHSDALLVKAGSGIATLGIPGSAGVPAEFAALTLALPYNDVAAVRDAFTRFPDEIAAVIVEPVVGNMGCVPPGPGYLKALREITLEQGALLIFDEVMTGFRVALGGAQELYGIRPDLTTMGKIIGGGFPVGAYGGSVQYMDMVAPLGPVYQAGTLSGNPVAMAAGLATLNYLSAHPEVYSRLEAMAGVLVKKIVNAAADAEIPLTANRVGSMFTWFFNAEEVTDFKSAAKSDLSSFANFHRRMLEAGIYLPPSQYEAAFLSAAHSEHDIRLTVEAADQAFQGMLHPVR